VYYINSKCKIDFPNCVIIFEKKSRMNKVRDGADYGCLATPIPDTENKNQIQTHSDSTKDCVGERKHHE
jgi:hypothetical protein